MPPKTEKRRVHNEGGVIEEVWQLLSSTPMDTDTQAIEVVKTAVAKFHHDLFSGKASKYPDIFLSIAQDVVTELRSASLLK